jgi:hypothetical protein
MSWLANREALQAEARKVDPSIILTPKSMWFWQALAWLLTIITFGKIKRDRFLQDFATTVGPLWGLPDDWSDADVRGLIPHEGRHTYQARVCGWFIPILGWIPFLAPWVGIPIQMLLYVVLPIPVGLTYFRYYFELDADVHEWANKLEAGIWTKERVWDDALRRAVSVSGADYFYPWPEKWVTNGYRKKADEVIAKYR